MCVEADCACVLVAAEPAGLPPAGLADGLRRIGRLSARAEARYAAWVAEAEGTDAAKTRGFPSTTGWLMALSGEPAAVCRKKVVPARWCDTRHNTHWADGGTTDLPNLRLLCARHHTDAHQDEWHPRRE